MIEVYADHRTMAYLEPVWHSRREPSVVGQFFQNDGLGRGDVVREAIN